MDELPSPAPMDLWVKIPKVVSHDQGSLFLWPMCCKPPDVASRTGLCSNQFDHRHAFPPTPVV